MSGDDNDEKRGKGKEGRDENPRESSEILQEDGQDLINVEKRRETLKYTDIYTQRETEYP